MLGDMLNYLNVYNLFDEDDSNAKETAKKLYVYNLYDLSPSRT